MSYFYKPKKRDEIEQIAEQILSRFPNRRHSLSVNIEGILEDLGLDLLPRQGIRPHAEGYLAKDPRYIVVDESIFAYLPRARFTIAEEVCHLILEYKMWTGGTIPEGASCHELTEDQHFYVEKDAKSLASALLMPRDDFKVSFKSKLREFETSGVPRDKVIGETLKALAAQFEVSPKAAFYRALNLRLINKDGEPI